MALLEYVFGNNTALTPLFSVTLLSYPDPCGELLHAKFRPSIEQMKTSLDLLLRHWNPMQQYCAKRNLPPSPLEVGQTFRISSPELQKALCSALIQSVPSLRAQNTDQVEAAFEGLQRHRLVQNITMDAELQLWAQMYANAIGKHPAGSAGALQQRSLPPRRVSHGQQATSSVAATPSPQNRATPGRVSYGQQVASSAATTLLPQNSVTAAVQWIQSPTLNQTNRAVRPDPRLSSALGGQAFQMQQQVPQAHPLLPPEGVHLAQAVNPNPDRVALHQAHLRPANPQLRDDEDRPCPDLRLYQVVTKPVLGPALLTQKTRYFKSSFEIDALSLRHKTRFIAAGHSAFDPERQSEFYATSTTWPEHLFITFNNEDIELRRKPHYGRCLPAYLTKNVKAGNNTFEISHDQTEKEATSKQQFWIAVELLECLSHKRIREFITRLDADSVLRDITNRLKPIDDDDLVIAGATLSVDVIDPFTAQIWKIPVRSKYCLHRECFDLETFLKSRTKVHEGPYSPDEFKCPHCKKDARPANLIIDGFLEKVRATLEEQGKLQSVKAILVNQDGEWEAKEELDVQADTTMEGTPVEKAVDEPGSNKDRTISVTLVLDLE
ncbi:uncharacterized protein AB675_8435 [Cyphellophora attinorum]|uniref:SP-RING-type domain-containing protein n=1 Tax=Cyphellophora attinorum TaxID=1664694 RepID=A0A0N0NQW5_9EURO|nr:uncharacterized protein AB675_8435 [Phialophora attinorum]KPI44401.1 hypothetical protein AB675_8435 [Phialophora attinorum]